VLSNAEFDAMVDHMGDAVARIDCTFAHDGDPGHVPFARFPAGAAGIGAADAGGSGVQSTTLATPSAAALRRTAASAAISSGTCGDPRFEGSKNRVCSPCGLPSVSWNP
jgi:hypothetical protein